MLRELHRLTEGGRADLFPHRPPAPWPAYLRRVRLPAGGSRERHWVARREHGAVGLAELEILELGQQHPFAEAMLIVDPAWRRRGVGSELLEAVVRVAPGEAAPVLSVAAVLDSPGASFLDDRGLACKSVERLGVLDLATVDIGKLGGWVAAAPALAKGYSLVQWSDACPDDLLERFARLRDVMNTAPLDDSQFDPMHWTPERVRTREAAIGERGDQSWTLVARHDASGGLAGFTRLRLAADRPGLASQGDTGVDPAHRGRRLGRWLKAAMVLRLRAERPDVTCIETGNAASNAPMLAINDAMGFRTVTRIGLWQADTATLTARLEDQ